MIVSIETPVFKGARLERCIDSVLYQTSPNWTFSLLWDGGDVESRRILQELERRKLPNVTIYFADNRGIAKARRFLTQHSRGEYILPLDDDDALPANAVERFLSVAERVPWASVIRGQRKIIDEDGTVLDTPPWFPFEPRHYHHGMVTDLMNHSQPYLIRRSAYERTSGWEGFEDFGFAGEDCDLYLKLEENGTIELVDEVLYYYRVHSKRQSLVLTDDAAFEMWRRLADKTITRIGLPLSRRGEKPPFTYEPMPRTEPTLAMVDFFVLGGDRTAHTLQRSGAADDAIHFVVEPSASALDAACRRTRRPLVCIVDAEVDVAETRRIESFLRRMHEESADLAAPKILSERGAALFAHPTFADTLAPVIGSATGERGDGPGPARPAAWVSEYFTVARREVLNAGGFDTGFDDIRAAMLDLSLRARQRDFRCVYIGDVAFTHHGTARDVDSTVALDRLRDKWKAYPQLFEP